MNRKTVNTVIILGILSILSILLIQLYWIQKTTETQRVKAEIQKKEDSLNVEQFSQRAHIALRNVLQEVLKTQDAGVDLYGAVKQIRPNYFTVDVVDTLHPFYLEQVLKREFDNESLNEDFVYGIYDCYDDSIVFGNLIRYTEDSSYATSSEQHIGQTTEQLKWKNDGHYFTVLFPNVKVSAIDVQKVNFSPWIYMFSVLILILIFFLYSLNVILKQKRLSEVKNDFINNMTHELKTPISTIGLSSELLMRSDFTSSPERLKQYAEIIYKENKRLENQVERVLNVAKMDKNKITLHKALCPVHDLIVNAKSSFDVNNELNSGTIDLMLEAADDNLFIDEVHITNVIYNLIDNAVKYCQEVPKITIRTGIEKDLFVLAITDNGIGMKREDIRMIFDKFYRVPTGNLHDVKGFGLGLYYVKLIIEEHGGEVQVNSTPGKGTTFYLKLPFKR